jgi:hypothetical protein
VEASENQWSEDQGFRTQAVGELPAGFEGVEAGGRWHNDVESAR